MSASCEPIDYNHPAAHESLPLDLLKDAAELRAAGRDWEEVGAELGRNATHLRLACRRDPRFESELEAAHRAVLREAEAEVLRKFRARLRDPDVPAGVRAAECLARYLTARRNCEARVQVEEIKTEAKLGAEQVKVEAKAAPREPKPEERTPSYDRDCEQIQRIARMMRAIRKVRRQANAKENEVALHAGDCDSHEQRMSRAESVGSANERVG